MRHGSGVWTRSMMHAVIAQDMASTRRAAAFAHASVWPLGGVGGNRPPCEHACKCGLPCMDVNAAARHTAGEASGIPVASCPASMNDLHREVMYSRTAHTRKVMAVAMRAGLMRSRFLTAMSSSSNASTVRSLHFFVKAALQGRPLTRKTTASFWSSGHVTIVAVRSCLWVAQAEQGRRDPMLTACFNFAGIATAPPAAAPAPAPLPNTQGRHRQADAQRGYVWHIVAATPVSSYGRHAGSSDEECSASWL